MEEQLLQQIAAAVAASPDAVALRLHYARLLSEHGSVGAALEQIDEVLRRDPSNREAIELRGQLEARAFDWRAAESQLDEAVPPAFVEGSVDSGDRVSGAVAFSDVAGMDATKAKIEAAFLAPLRHPELRAFLGKRLRGGLLLYGPPGCGKTYLARAVAGEIGASFFVLSIAEVLAGQWAGDFVRNIREAFLAARAGGPAVVFVDELDALGARRAQQHGGFRILVNQLLEEMDGVGRRDDDEVFVLAATNHPWDVDPAFTRPGRLDQMVFVPPPDAAARAAIFRIALTGRPVERIDLEALAERSDGYSGADLVRVCESAAEQVLMEITRTATMRMIGMPDLLEALASTRPSIGAWLETARNVVTFANGDGRYDDLAAFLAANRRRR